MTDSYHFQIEPEPRVEVPKFRIGGVYRNGHGDGPWRLVADPLAPAGFASITEANPKDGNGYKFQPHWRISDGRWVQTEYESGMHLIPGEMIQRDGQWVAADSIGPFPSGATLTTSGDKIVGRVEAQPEPISLGAILRRALDRLVVPAPAPEPIRPALDWDTAKPFDTFGPDFIVTKGAVEATTTPSPTTDSAYPAIAGLLRVSDGGPANASASLLLKTA